MLGRAIRTWKRQIATLKGNRDIWEGKYGLGKEVGTGMGNRDMRRKVGTSNNMELPEGNYCTSDLISCLELTASTHTF